MYIHVESSGNTRQRSGLSDKAGDWADCNTLLLIQCLNLLHFRHLPSTNLINHWSFRSFAFSVLFYDYIIQASNKLYQDNNTILYSDSKMRILHL